MISVLRLAGPKVLGAAIIALVVFLSLGWMQKRIEQNTVQEYKIEQMQKEIHIRKNVDEILQQNYESNPDRDGSIALDRLRKKYRDSGDSK